MQKDPFKEYLKEKEPTKKEKAYSWYTAIGLQKVDGLDTSKYLNDLAIKNIEGEVSLDDVSGLINSYYEEKNDDTNNNEEADKVSINIAKILSEKAFVFSPIQYLDIHKKLFKNIFPHAGKIRTYNISKKEWVLNGDTVIYGGASMLNETLEYDFSVEKNYDYSNISRDDFIKHIARFISNLWQIHVFAEGNTRTTAVFLIKYLKTFGYDVENDIFANNAWYFRNSLVRANYSNIEKGITETTLYLELFLRNLLLNENNELKNRYLHIDFNKKVNIDDKKVDIDDKKVDIQTIDISDNIRKKVAKMHNELSNKEYFGRTEVMNVLELSPSGASKFISSLLIKNIIIPVDGYGKGKYVFNEEIIYE